jgi:hypothetical protein
MENVVFILVLLLIGIGLKRVKDFPKNTAVVLTAFVINISLPALILVQIPKIPLTKDILIPFLMPWAMILFSATLIWVLARVFRWNKSITGALMLMVPLGNTSFFGIPMVETFYGVEGVPYAILYDQLGTFLALGTYGSFVVAFYGQKESTKATSVLKRIATFPPLIALILAFALKPITYPEQVVFILESIAATLIPLVIIAVGLKMQFKIASEYLRPLGVGLGIKLVIAPLLALAIILTIGLDSLAAKISVFEAGMPPQIGAWALAMTAGLEAELSSMMVGLGILVSFITLSLLYLIV